MVLCLVALPVLAVLGLFSLRYRRLAREALDCLGRTVTLRKCRSKLDARFQAYLAGKLLRRAPRAAKVVHRHFALLTWLVMAVLVWSLVVSGVGMYNYAKYGSCNGPASTGFCLLDPEGGGLSEVDSMVPSTLEWPVVEDDDPLIGSPNASLTIIEFGCYACPYTRKAEPTVAQVLEHYGGRVNVQFKSFAIPHHNLSVPAAMAADCALEQGRYEPYHRALFARQETLSNVSLVPLASELGLDEAAFAACLSSGRYHAEVEADTAAGMRAGVLGTPTFFVGNRTIVGPKPFKTFTALIDAELGK